MNALRKHTGYLAKCSLDSFSGIGDHKVFPRFMRLQGITFSCNHQFNAFCIHAYLFIIIICVCTIAIQSTIFRQIKKHVFHPINIMVAPREHSKFNRYSIYCCNYLNCEPIEVFSHGSFIAPVLITLNNFGSTDTNVLTRRHREAINSIFR